MAPHVCRRILLFLDGTWNEDEDVRPATNIVYLRERLFWGLQNRLRKRGEADTAAFKSLPISLQKKGVSGIIFDGFEYLAYYDRGVGTGAYFDVLKGGLTGDGLDQNIREAYRFLSTWFRPGDEIFIFGFSRGAFTARSLCGFMQSCGLLREEYCTKEIEDRAWQFYRTPPGDRLSAEWLHFRKKQADGKSLVHDENYLRVRVLGVFDTVGALGVPASGFRRINRANYEFHDPEANSIVDVRLHAVSIDEPRWAFSPTLWTKPKFKRIHPTRSPTEQVWFSGAHADIGGGYAKWNLGEYGLSEIPMAWMLQRVQYHVMNTRSLAPEVDEISPVVTPRRDMPLPFFTDDLFDGDLRMSRTVKRNAVGRQHKPWALASVVRPDGVRAINQIPVPKRFRFARKIPWLGKKLPHFDEERGRVPYADPICEYVHAAALERLRKQEGNLIDKWGLNKIETIRRLIPYAEKRYRPKNLVNVVLYIALTYLDHHKPDPESASPWRDFIDGELRKKLKTSDCGGDAGHIPEILIPKIYPWKHLHIVDWDGKPLDPTDEEDARCALGMLPKPEDIDLTALPKELDFIRDYRAEDIERKAKKVGDAH